MRKRGVVRRIDGRQMRGGNKGARARAEERRMDKGAPAGGPDVEPLVQIAASQLLGDGGEATKVAPGTMNQRAARKGGRAKAAATTRLAWPRVRRTTEPASATRRPGSPPREAVSSTATRPSGQKPKRHAGGPASGVRSSGAERRAESRDRESGPLRWDPGRRRQSGSGPRQWPQASGRRPE